MKKAQYILIAAMALVASAACTKTVEQPEPEGIQMTYMAYQEGAHNTKTTVQDGGTQVLWEPADEIKVFFKSFTGRFVSQNNTPADIADFSGTLSILVGANEGAESAYQTWGLYPYRADAAYDGEYVTTTLPTEQTGKAGSFARNTHICLARSGGHDLAFYNVTGGLRFSLTQEGISSVSFEGNDGEAIAGKIKMTFEDGIPVIKEVSEGESVITLTAPNGDTFQTGQWYYIEAIPGTLSKGFKMVFYKDDESATLTAKSPVTFRRGKYGSLADADDGLIFKPTGGDTPDPSANIQFADPIAKYACVEKFDANGDGEVSYEEASAATSLTGLFADWNTVTSFDEIKYFTSVISTEGVFAGLTKLESITIPDNITTLGTFKGCTALKTVVLPAALSSLPASCFDGCTNLTDITIPTEIKTIPNYCFQNCSSLVNLELPTGVKTIGNYTFQNCSALASLDLPPTLTSIGNNSFSGCTGITSVSLCTGVSIGTYAFSKCLSLESVILPSDLTSIPDGCFRRCYALSSITWPEDLSSIGSYAFDGCSFADNDYTLQLPSTVTSIGSQALTALRHLIIPSPSAVSIASDSFGPASYIFLYVPSGLVEMYKIRTNWSNYTDGIYRIEDYPAISIGGEPVDLGLSVKWSSCNVGASNPAEYGDYFAWGEIKPKSDYSKSTYKWYNGNYNLTKYCSSYKKDYWGDYGSPDGKTVLKLEDDAARVNWGGNWRMPTVAEWQELRNNCSWGWTWTTNNSGTGIAGYKVTSKKTGYTNNSIFLPAAGYRLDTGLHYVGSYGDYWSSSLYTDYPHEAWSVYYCFYSGYDYKNNASYRYYGFSVRPVTQ